MRLRLLPLVLTALLSLSLAGCGQTGKLYLRMPPTTLPPLDPPPHVKPLDILPPPGSTAPAAVTAQTPAAATHAPGHP
jgi:predicted small lipoprotein YifL